MTNEETKVITAGELNTGDVVVANNGKYLIVRSLVDLPESNNVHITFSGGRVLTADKTYGRVKIRVDDWVDGYENPTSAPESVTEYRRG